MNKHTPGPWKITAGKAQDGTLVHVIQNPDHVWICTSCAPREQNEANAHLIAAAPELLEACKLAEKYFREMVAGPETHYPEFSMLRAAIAKSEGK